MIGRSRESEAGAAGFSPLRIEPDVSAARCIDFDLVRQRAGALLSAKRATADVRSLRCDLRATLELRRGVPPVSLAAPGRDAVEESDRARERGLPVVSTFLFPK